jgi:hypothetical protein
LNGLIFKDLLLEFFFCNCQGKSAEGMVHLERVGSLEEPEEARIKAHYYDGIVLLARYEMEGVNNIALIYFIPN